MKELSAQFSCPECPFEGNQSICRGLEGNSHKKSAILVLQNADDREGQNYSEALFKSQAGRRIINITDGLLDDIVILNAVKCKFDPGETPPKPARDACRPNTLLQIASIKENQPDTGIVCIGKVASEMLLPGKQFEKVRGKIVRKGRDKILPIGHVSRGATKKEMEKTKKFIRSLRQK